MDDFIYFIFLIAWLAFSFYQQSAKKKKRQEQMKAAREREMTQDEESMYEETSQEIPMTNDNTQTREKQPDFRKTLEEILLGKEFSNSEIDEQEPIQREDATTGEVKKGDSEPVTNRFQKYYDEEMLEGTSGKMGKQYEKLLDKVEQPIDEMLVEGEEDYAYEGDSKDFDLRKAVIYSEILNRRYK